MKPFNKGQKNDYNDAEAIAEAALRPNLRTISEKSQDQLDLQALHRVRSRLVSRRTATINQIRAFLIEQGITIRKGLRAVQNSLLALLDERRDEISPRMRHIILDLHDDWMRLYPDRSDLRGNRRDRARRGTLQSAEDHSRRGSGDLDSPCRCSWSGAKPSIMEEIWRPGSGWCPDNTAQVGARRLAGSRSGEADICEHSSSRLPRSS